MKVIDVINKELVGKKIINASCIERLKNGDIDKDYYESINMDAPILGMTIKKVGLTSNDREGDCLILSFEEDELYSLKVDFFEELTVE